MGAIGELFGRIFGTEKAIDNVLDKDSGLLVKAGSWFGNLNYTTEDQAEMNLEVRKVGVNLLNALHPFKLMQRIMVTIIMVEWAILFNVFIIAICFQAHDILKDLMAFAQTEFAWVPIAGAVSLYLLGGTWPSRKVDK